jgi:hypothetical protein
MTGKNEQENDVNHLIYACQNCVYSCHYGRQNGANSHTSDNQNDVNSTQLQAVRLQK